MKRNRRQPIKAVPSTRTHAARNATALVRESQRARILDAMVRSIADTGSESPTVEQVVRLAGVSKSTFYALFEDRSDCLRAVLDEAVRRAAERGCLASESQACWAGRMRAGLAAVLDCLDDEPNLSRLCVAEAVAARPAALTRRGELLAAAARVIDEGRGELAPRCEPPPSTARSVVGGALGVMHARLLLDTGPRPLAGLLNPLMGMIVLPYLGEQAALRELSHPAPEASAREPRPARDPLPGIALRLTHRTLRTLSVIAGEPGLSNTQISERAGITDQGQISKLLARLARLGLAENTREDEARTAQKSWRLTQRGEELERAMRRRSLETRL
jgi:AcrR family transcriptional regulator/DNA-binding MarR family transcriptional regulator